MSTTQVETGGTYPVRMTLTDRNGFVVQGATVALSVRRLSDDNWYVGGDTPWQAGYGTVAMVETDPAPSEVGDEGRYEYDFPVGAMPDTYLLRAKYTHVDGTTDYYEEELLAVAATDLGDVETAVAAIQDQTDQLAFTAGDVHATLDGEEVITDSASRTASKADVSGLALASVCTEERVAKLDVAGTLLHGETVIESGITIVQALQVILASGAGMLAGAPGGPLTFSTPDGLTVRMTVEVDGDGNRTGVTLNV